MGDEGLIFSGGGCFTWKVDMKGLLFGRLIIYPYDSIKFQELSGNIVAVFWVEESGLVLMLGVMRVRFLGHVDEIHVVN